MVKLGKARRHLQNPRSQTAESETAYLAAAAQQILLAENGDKLTLE